MWQECFWGYTSSGGGDWECWPPGKRSLRLSQTASGPLVEAASPDPRRSQPSKQTG